jgi:hypothetical protein
MIRWAALATTGCLTALAGLYWYVRCLEDHDRRWPLFEPLAVFIAGCLIVGAALIGAVEWGD